jgi:hypothetical protein
MMRCRSARVSSTGRHRSKTAASPPTNTRSVPARAAGTPIPRAGAAAASSRPAAGLLLVMSTHGRGRHGEEHAARSRHHLTHFTRAGQHLMRNIGACGYRSERGAPLRPHCMTAGSSSALASPALTVCDSVGAGQRSGADDLLGGSDPEFFEQVCLTPRPGT